MIPIVVSGLWVYFFHSHDRERVREWFHWLARQMTDAGCTMQKFGQVCQSFFVSEQKIYLLNTARLVVIWFFSGSPCALMYLIRC
jgi:hypothetical protein